MKCQVLVAVILHLLAMYWMCLFIFGILGIAGALSQVDYLSISYSLLAPVFYGILSFLIWIFAEPISHRVVGHTNPELSLKEVTAEHLYTCGILVLGVYHAASHLPQLLNMLHYQVVHKKGDAWVQGNSGFSTYDLTNEFFAFAIGVTLVVFAPMIARKVTKQAERIARRKVEE